MEPAPTKIILGEFPITELRLDAIRVRIGKEVSIWIHLGDFPHDLKPGDTLPLFTEIKYAISRSAPIE